jgi:hypothetical protein
MKATRRVRPVPRLEAGATDDEAARWAQRHDVFDRVARGVSEVVEDHRDLDRLLERALFEDNRAQLNMRVPRAMKAALGRLARERTTDTTTLARIWLAERLRQELRGRGRASGGQ